MSNHHSENNTNWRINFRVSILLKICLFIGVSLLFYQGRYQAMAETLIIILITFLPLIFRERFKVKIPHEFESLAVLFIFMSLFLGEIHGYYIRFWWWDIVLHTGSGFLLGILGFLLVYVLNEKKEIELELNPKFIALFAFMFAMGIGAIWEIVEFTADSLLGLNMQKSGLVDTMWDLIVDGVGALTISLLGWGFLTKRTHDSFLEAWIDKFIEKNPWLFSKK